MGSALPMLSPGQKKLVRPYLIPTRCYWCAKVIKVFEPYMIGYVTDEGISYTCIPCCHVIKRKQEEAANE